MIEGQPAFAAAMLKPNTLNQDFRPGALRRQCAVMPFSSLFSLGTVTRVYVLKNVVGFLARAASNY
jgi:hypothetical protein